MVVAALLAGVLAFAAYAALSPPRLTDPDEVTAALDVPSTSRLPNASTPSPTPSSTATPTPPATSSPTPTPTPTPSPSASARSAAPTRPPAGPPTDASTPTSFRVEIPSLKAVLPVLPVGVAKDGQMALPKDPDIGGWYRFGPGPTSEGGASVISAHVDSRDEVGPLAKLPKLKKGARILVVVDGARVEYIVERVDQYAKTALDTEALFSRTGPARLHLVSCGGQWNPRTRHYEDNVVAIARRASVTEGVAYRGPRGQ